MAPASFVVDRVSEFDINGISLKEGIQKSGFSRKDWFENIVKTEKICIHNHLLNMPESRDDDIHMYHQDQQQYHEQ